MTTRRRTARELLRGCSAESVEETQEAVMLLKSMPSWSRGARATALRAVVAWLDEELRRRKGR